jgi:hypothetical protein
MTALVMAFLMKIDKRHIDSKDFIEAIEIQYGDANIIMETKSFAMYRVDTTDEDIEYDCIDNPSIVIEWYWE